MPKPLDNDISAYTSLFDAKASLPKALVAFRANAKKDSTRAAIAAYLESQIILPQEPLNIPPKSKTAPKNPYLDIWSWSCHNLEYAGPTKEMEKIRHAHHILPVFYHHFGCVPPTQAALSLIEQLAVLPAQKIEGEKKGKGKATRPAPKEIIEIGSGAGYWTFMLRRTFPNLTVTAVDSGLSTYRTTWIPDTVIADGPTYLRNHQAGHGTVLLLVYPSVSDDFTAKVFKEFEGDAVVIAGTLNHNGFTAFKGMTVAEWVEKEEEKFKGNVNGCMLRCSWQLAARLPLPSFAGKDEGLFVFRRTNGTEMNDNGSDQTGATGSK
jgi:hypothetical protein